MTDAWRDVVMMALALGAAVTLAATGHEELAATALGGALAYAVPSPRRVPPALLVAVAALTAGALAGG